MVHSKLVTQGIDTNIQQDSTLSLVFNVYHERQFDNWRVTTRFKKLTSLGIIVDAHLFMFG